LTVWRLITWRLSTDATIRYLDRGVEKKSCPLVSSTSGGGFGGAYGLKKFNTLTHIFDLLGIYLLATRKVCALHVFLMLIVVSRSHHAVRTSYHTSAPSPR